MNNTDIINEAFENGITGDNKNNVSNAVTETISSLDQGKLRVAENKDGQWTVNEWDKESYLTII
jgi:2,3,4,5-tetrahydropyridine-2-carboxylate N-succinyltransferase